MNETGASTYIKSGWVTSRYYNLSDIYSDIGKPQNGVLNYSDFVVVADDVLYADNLIIYISGISALCSNTRICDEYLPRSGLEVIMMGQYMGQSTDTLGAINDAISSLRGDDIRVLFNVIP